MENAAIVAYARTPIGKFQGSLKSFSAADLGAQAIQGALKKVGLDPQEVQSVIMGCVLPAGQGQNPARQAALKAGCSSDVSALTINKVCGSGLKAVMLAQHEIMVGESSIMVAGGMESMTNAPYLLPQARAGSRLGHATMLDSMVHDGLWCPFEDWHMGCAADHIASEHDVSRQDQDDFAAQSQQKAAAAMEAGHFKGEIVPIEIPQRKGGPIIFDQDEGVRADSDAQGLGKLKACFTKDGTVTPGNASTINDGAAACVVMSESEAQKRGLPIEAKIVCQATAGVDPKNIFFAPVHAVKKLCERAKISLNEVDIIEANEAFAAQVLADGKALEIDPTKLNPWGGAIALGHPIGASGARVLATLISGLKHSNAKRGIATLCLGGGEAVALLVERT